MLKISVTKNGKELDKDLYSWNEETRIFSSNENGLVLDFSDINNCTFKTKSYCTFKAGSGCMFNTGSNCTFTTGSYCTFDTVFGCTFDTGSDCTFKTGADCTFDTEYNCVVVRRDVFEVIQLLNEENHIKLNQGGIKGYEVIGEKHIITIDGKEIELSEESFNELKKQLI